VGRGFGGFLAALRVITLAMVFGRHVVALSGGFVVFSCFRVNIHGHCRFLSSNCSKDQCFSDKSFPAFLALVIRPSADKRGKQMPIPQ
jgi:hypothetical protein